MRNRTLVIYISILLSGCASPIVFTDISGESRNIQSLLDDRYECLQDASSDESQISGRADSASARISGSSGLTCNANIMRACLSARGWIKDGDALGAENAIAIPDQAIIDCGSYF